jgi:putative FmdB family regulatory protein
MPLYEYECETCSHRFEVIQKFSDAPISVCPKCGGPVQKLLSSPAIQFKGSGFYLTDYGRGTSSKSESANTKAGKAESGATSGGGDSAAKSDSGGSSDSKTSSSDSSSAKPAASKSE